MQTGFPSHSFWAAPHATVPSAVPTQGPQLGQLPVPTGGGTRPSAERGATALRRTLPGIAAEAPGVDRVRLEDHLPLRVAPAAHVAVRPLGGAIGEDLGVRRRRPRVVRGGVLAPSRVGLRFLRRVCPAAGVLFLRRVADRAGLGSALGPREAPGVGDLERLDPQHRAAPGEERERRDRDPRPLQNAPPIASPLTTPTSGDTRTARDEDGRSFAESTRRTTDAATPTPPTVKNTVETSAACPASIPSWVAFGSWHAVPTHVLFALFHFELAATPNPTPTPTSASAAPPVTKPQLRSALPLLDRASAGGDAAGGGDATTGTAGAGDAVGGAGAGGASSSAGTAMSIVFASAAIVTSAAHAFFPGARASK